LVADELDAERPELFQREEQMFRGACEPIKAPHHYCVKLPFASVAHQYIKFGTGVFRPRLAHVNVFADKIKSPRSAVGSEIAGLHFATLIFRADACVYCDSHVFVLRRDERERLADLLE
jgi:hypothetical protein